jgi:hypothetical protein
MASFEVLGITDAPGCCDLCGTWCPRRRVAVQLSDNDHGEIGDVQYWGVVCAAEARSGRRDSTIARQIREEADEAGSYTPGRHHARHSARGIAARRQPRKTASATFADRQIVWIRTASPVPAKYETENGVDAAAYRYRQTGRPTGGAYFASDDAGHIAVIDGADRADVARFLAAGFTIAAWGRLADWPASGVAVGAA